MFYTWKVQEIDPTPETSEGVYSDRLITLRVFSHLESVGIGDWFECTQSQAQLSLAAGLHLINTVSIESDINSLAIENNHKTVSIYFTH